MCGIAGILRVTPAGEEAREMLARPPWEAIPERWLDILDDSIKHRGPDGAGRFRDRVMRADGCLVDVALVHRRLAIIDLVGGHQPMMSLGKGQGVLTGADRYTIYDGLGLYEPGEYDHLSGAAQAAGGDARIHGRQPSSCTPPEGVCPFGSGRVAVVFNGCIYNHRELRQELQAAGHTFSTGHSDTEVLVHGWRQWGADLRDRIDGMGAYVIWDGAAGTLAGFRDRFGEKPLYFYMDNESRLTVCSSTATGLVGILGADGRQKHVLPNGALVAQWISLGYHATRTPAAYISQVPPGAVLLAPGNDWDDLDYVAKKEWKRTAPGEFRRSLAAPLAGGSLADRIELLLHRAVTSRLEADVPIACLLSGGVDSSLVSLMASGAVESLTSVCVRMQDPRYDESVYAQEVAAIIGSDHHTIDASADPASDLVMLIEQLGLPFGDSSLLPTYWACVAAKQHATVLLSGDGGDELFLGYERFTAAKWLELAGMWFLNPLLQLGHAAHPKSKWSKLARLARAEEGEGYTDLLAIFDSGDRYSLMGRVYESLSLAGTRARSAAQAQRVELLSHFPGDMLRKTDTAAMAVGIELRAPFLARELADEVLSLNPFVLMPRGQRKGLLRSVARKYFPPEIVDRPKMGFAIPIGEWFRTNYGGMRDLLLDHLNSAEPFGPDSLGINAMINMKFVRQMLKEHDDAGEGSRWPWKGRDHSQRLYMLLVLSIWAKWMAGVPSSVAPRA